ncbi:hypothetical protein [Micromonospora sediminicola]|uniref:hypothetical protein n=1 Tax=Micromonospora sediminicola TaxID=946078 RepID=UPI001C3FF9FA|nr:hypothetical protein [Micromonospora sediminicola]
MVLRVEDDGVRGEREKPVDDLTAPVVPLLVEVDTALAGQDEITNRPARSGQIGRVHDHGGDKKPSLLGLVDEDVRGHGTRPPSCRCSDLVRR